MLKLKNIYNLCMQILYKDLKAFKFDRSRLHGLLKLSNDIIDSATPILLQTAESCFGTKIYSLKNKIDYKDELKTPSVPTVTHEDGVTTPSAPTVTHKGGVTTPPAPTVTHEDGVTTPQASTVTHEDGVTNPSIPTAPPEDGVTAPSVPIINLHETLIISRFQDHFTMLDIKTLSKPAVTLTQIIIWG